VSPGPPWQRWPCSLAGCGLGGCCDVADDGPAAAAALAAATACPGPEKDPDGLCAAGQNRLRAKEQIQAIQKTIKSMLRAAPPGGPLEEDLLAMLGDISRVMGYGTGGGSAAAL